MAAAGRDRARASPAKCSPPPPASGGGVAGLTSILFGVRLAEKNAEFRRNKTSAYDEAQAARLERAREYRAISVGAEHSHELSQGRHTTEE